MALSQSPQIAINPLRLTVHNHGTILVVNRDGSIDGGVTGLYADDTRYLSRYRVTLNQRDPILLSTVRPTYLSVTHTYTNPDLGRPTAAVPMGSLFLRVDRAVGAGLHEDITLTNYAGRTVDVQVLISLDADFADIMQVRDLPRWLPYLTKVDWARSTPRIVKVDWDDALNALSFSYQKESFERALTYRLVAPGTPIRRLGQSIEVDLTLAPGATWRAATSTTFGPTPAPARVDVSQTTRQRAETPTSREAQEWVESVARIVVPDGLLQATFDQAVVDFASLRFEQVADGWFPAAGVPWFVAVFGRDSIWASLQALLVSGKFGRGTLAKLASLQSHENIPRRDQEPGKLPHEVRVGELTCFGRLPYSPYYGTADASLLYVSLLADEFACSGDKEFISDYLSVAETCLAWAADWGDLDGDGFVEYRPRSPQGYHNQGWKDAFDAIVYPDGQIVDDPIALCEIQGYYYAARRAMARLLRACDRVDDARAWDRRADDLFRRFDARFWMPDLDFYALGLDPRKKQIRTIASNAGQLLWSQIVPPARATPVVRRLFAPDLFAGWGIRTLSSENRAFNPISYQRGSVWPHDNGIIALGLKRYGFWREANQIARAIFDAAALFENHSLPELFAGLERRPNEPPVPYVDANVPQAWAAGSVFHLFQMLIGLEVDASRGIISVQPTLPDWLPLVELRGFTAASTQIDLRFVGAAPTTHVEVIRHDGPARVEVRPVGGWTMWSYVNLGLAALAGFSAGYVALLANYWFETVLGLTGLDFGEIGLLFVGRQAPGTWGLGVLFHLIDSALLGAFYGLAIYPLAKSSLAVRSPLVVGIVGGIAFGVAVWLILAMLIAMPLLGLGIFGRKSHTTSPAILTLVLHVLFGLILGFVYLP